MSTSPLTLVVMVVATATVTSQASRVTCVGTDARDDG